MPLSSSIQSSVETLVAVAIAYSSSSDWPIIAIGFRILCGIIGGSVLVTCSLFGGLVGLLGRRLVLRGGLLGRGLAGHQPLLGHLGELAPEADQVAHAGGEPGQRARDHADQLALQYVNTR